MLTKICEQWGLLSSNSNNNDNDLEDIIQKEEEEDNSINVITNLLESNDRLLPDTVPDVSTGKTLSVCKQV